MADTTIKPTIASRPVYGKLQAQKGLRHLFVANAEGGAAILDMAKHTPQDFFKRAHIIYIPEHCQHLVAPLEALAAMAFYIGPSFSAAKQRIQKVLADAQTGLVVYTAGTEGVMGKTISEALAVGIPYTDVQTEHRGSTARRVQCVHCKGITEEVKLDPFVCAHCGLHLFVRDHYSRRLAAFQGVRVDAEDPGNIPQAVERFL